MQAMALPRFKNSSLAASKSLKGKFSVCFAKSAGTPGELGMPNVSAPDPALTSRLSEWP